MITKRSKVASVKVPIKVEKDMIFESIRKAMNLACWKDYVKGKNIVLKVNAVWDKVYPGCTTTPMIIESLRKIGFSEKEAVVYTHLIRLGAQPVSVIAERAKINRTTTYDIIENLTKKGLVSSIKKDGITHFKALDPKELVNYLEREKVEHVKKLEKQQKVRELI